MQAFQQFVQQLINGIVIGSIYSLVALGYTMVFGILGFINFAHGDVYMIGCYLGLVLLGTGAFSFTGALVGSVILTARSARASRTPPWWPPSASPSSWRPWP
jgi:branched-chain amino acid transport system permease protein